MAVMFQNLAKRYYGLSIRARVAALVIVCLVPAWLTTSYITWAAFERERAALIATLRATTETLLRNVELTIGGAEARLRILASSTDLERGDFAKFHALASDAGKQMPGLGIVLFGPSGEQIVNTATSYGESLPAGPGLVFQRVRESGQPVLTDLIFGPVLKKRLVALAIPIFKAERLAYVLALTMDETTLAPMLVQPGRPDAWVAGIFDSTGTIVARSHFPERYVGQKGIQAVLDSLHGPAQGTTETTILEGTQVVLAWDRSARFGWTAVIAVPKAVLEAELRRSLWLSLIAGIVVLGTGLYLARRIAGDISGPIQALILPAIAIGSGEDLAITPLGLKEADEVRQALAAATCLIRERTEERDTARTSEREISQQYAALRALNNIASQPNISASEQLTRALALGARHFGLPLGIISRIEGGTYTVLHHDSPPESGLHEGQTFKLGETYCSITMDRHDVVAVAKMGASIHKGHPCYKAFNLETYIGAPIFVRGASFGTVNFSSSEPFGRDFDPGDSEFMRLLARWIGAIIERDLSHQEIVAARDSAESAQRTLASQAKQLADINSELEQFAYVASHDLREPLRMIMNYLSLINRRLGDQLDDDTKAFIGFAVDGAKRMDRLILDLLEFSRIGRRAGAAAPVALSEAVADALGNLALTIEETSAKVTVAADLPTVTGSQDELVRLIQNLVGNALKYRAPDRPPAISITAQAARNGDKAEWIVAIADNGIGIDAEYFQRIFSIFQRLHTREEYEGTGIGLAVCKKIVEQHGGRIWVDSTPGAGSTFFFALPDGPAAS